jgi:hypothetical protein
VAPAGPAGAPSRTSPGRLKVAALLAPERARRLALTVAGLRVALGVLAMVGPDLALRPWVGRPGGPERRVLARSLAGRDIALGLGALLAARRRAPLRGWVEAGSLADAGDVLGTALAFGRLPRAGRVLVLGAAAGAAVAGALAAPSV